MSSNENTLKKMPTNETLLVLSACTHAHMDTHTHTHTHYFLDAHHYAQQALWHFRMTCHSFYCFHLATVKVARPVTTGAAVLDANS